MKILNIILLIILIISLASTYSFSADISYKRYLPNSKFFRELESINVEGEITTGDYNKLLALIIVDPDKFISSRFVVLNSNGGDVIEAIKIGQLFKNTFKSVEVKGVCASSCFFIYIGAVERYVNEGSKLGIHRPYFSKDLISGLKPYKAEQLQNSMMINVRSYLSDNSIPQYLIDKMFMKSSSDIYWLNSYDIDDGLGYYSVWYEEYLSAKCNFHMLDVIKYPDKNIDNINCKSSMELQESKAYITTLLSDYKKASKKKPKLK